METVGSGEDGIPQVQMRVAGEKQGKKVRVSGMVVMMTVKEMKMKKMKMKEKHEVTNSERQEELVSRKSYLAFEAVPVLKMGEHKNEKIQFVEPPTLLSSWFSSLGFPGAGPNLVWL